MQQRQDFLVRRALLNRDQALLRRHDRGDRCVQLGLEAQVAMRHDADSLLAVDHRHAGDVHRPRQVDDFADTHVGCDRNRVADHAGLELLDLEHLPRLLLDRHVLVDYAQATFLRQRDRQPCLGHRVHRRRQQRDTQADVAGQGGAEVDFARQHLGITGLQQHVVECKGFLGNAHGMFFDEWRLIDQLYAHANCG